MVKLETMCFLDNFRRFMVSSTCKSFIPEDYLANPNIFPERPRDQGTMYVEAEDKVTLDRVQDITFVEVSSVLGIIYNSKSGHTQLKWRHVKGEQGRLTGDASTNTLVNLYEAGALDRSFVRTVASRVR